MKHVFFVFSPFHIALTNKIIEDCAIVNYMVIIFYEGGDAKVRYAESLFGKEHVRSFEIKKGLGVFLLIYDLLLMSKKYKYGKVIAYTASPKSFWFRFFFSRLARVETFNVMDDGVGVLDMKGYFMKPDGPIKRWFLKICLIKDDYLIFLERIDIYYKFYEFRSVYDRFCSKRLAVKPLFLSGAESCEDNQLNMVDFDPVRIFLTGPFSERGFVSKDTELKLYEKVVEKFGIHFFLKHPSDSLDKYNGCSFRFLDTELYAEQIIELLSKKRKVELYSFSSSVLVNFNGANNVKVYCLESFAIPAMSIHKELNVNILRLEDDS
ncbi:glycosyltransferase family 52 [Marinobacter nauticus]|uniref:glycosyltransferase family 52 n=1 Tax=Marinobacter nauticus TaxID=2743 RepID=UPI001C96B311|nr:glycosyltransferase family 52 [Marinobacter nauticus]MBY6219398.1 glycosyltransferase family 52 protein [Marinobacter nauticus]